MKEFKPVWLAAVYPRGLTLRRRWLATAAGADIAHGPCVIPGFFQPLARFFDALTAIAVRGLVMRVNSVICHH